LTPKEEKGWATRSTIIAYFGSTNLYKNGDETQQMFLEDIVLCIRKGYMPLLSCENIWLHIFLNIAPMFPCCISISSIFYGTFFSYNNHKHHELACVAKFGIYHYYFL
jgi:hypothetical protein